MASSVIYYSTYARQNEIYLFYTLKVVKKRESKIGEKLCYVVCDVIRDLYSNSARARTSEIASYI